MVESVASGKPEGHLLKEIRALRAGKMKVWPLREQLDRMYQTHVALCRRTRKVPAITEQIAVGIYLRYLPEDLGAEVRDLASDTDLETLYTKFAAAREYRRTAHPLLADARGLMGVSGDVTGLLTFTGELTGSRDPVLSDREPRAPAISAAMGVHRPGASFQEEDARPPVPDSRREGFPDRHARPTLYPPRVPPHPRPARWPQVHMASVQPPPPDLARSAGPSFHPMAPRRAPEFQSATAAVGWNPCFACGQTGHTQMNCVKYLQECARDPLSANRCPACNAVGLCPAECRRLLYFATSPYLHLELNQDGTSYILRCGLPISRWYRPELLVGPARATAPALQNPAAPEYRTAYAVHSAALPIAATPALPAPLGPTSGDPVLPQQDQGHRGNAEACQRQRGAAVRRYMPSLSEVHPKLFAGCRSTIQGPNRPSRFRVDRCV